MNVVNVIPRSLTKAFLVSKDRLRRILWALEDNADRIVWSIVGALCVGLLWYGLGFLLLAGEFK